MEVMMKSLAELKAIREKMQSQVSLRGEDHDHIRVMVGMAPAASQAEHAPS